MTADLPSGWTASTIGKSAVIASGVGFPLTLQGRTSGKYPVAKVRDISRAVLNNNGNLDFADHYIDEADLATLRAKPVAVGSVVFAKIGEGLRLNRRAITCCPLVLDNNCMALTAREMTDPRYLFWFMNTVDISPLAVATSVPSVRRTDIENLTFPLPPLAEQRRIVARIEALFARTRRARTDLERIAPLSERHRLAHLRAGVTGQLTEAWRQKHPAEDVRMTLRRIPAPEQGRGGRDATTDVTPGMAALSVNEPGTLAPPGWAWTPLLRVARQETGHTPSRRVPAYWDGGDVPWVGIRDAGAHHGTTIYDTMQKCTELGLANSSARLLPAGTVCLSRTASVGYVTVLGKSMATSQDFATWTCTPALLPEYLKFALLAEGDDIRRFGEGSTHTTIYFPEIRALHICLPPIEEQAEIVRILTSNAGGQTIASAEATRTLALLDRLEQSILARAFRGELVPQNLPDDLQHPAQAVGPIVAANPRRGRRAAA